VSDEIRGASRRTSSAASEVVRRHRTRARDGHDRYLRRVVRTWRLRL